MQKFILESYNSTTNRQTSLSICNCLPLLTNITSPIPFLCSPSSSPISSEHGENIWEVNKKKRSIQLKTAPAQALNFKIKMKNKWNYKFTKTLNCKSSTTQKKAALPALPIKCMDETLEYYLTIFIFLSYCILKGRGKARETNVTIDKNQ